MCEKPPSRRCQRRPLIRKVKCARKAAEEEECEQPKCKHKCVQTNCIQERKQPKCKTECEQPKCKTECEQPKCKTECEQPKCKQECEQPKCIQECPPTKCEQPKCTQEYIHTEKPQEQQEDGSQKCVHTEEQEEQCECGQAESIKFRLVGMSTRPNAIEFEMEGMDSEECLYTVNESREFRITSSISTGGARSRTGTEPGFAGEFFHKILNALRILKCWTRDQCRKVQNAVTARQGPQVYYFPCTNDYV